MTHDTTEATKAPTSKAKGILFHIIIFVALLFLTSGIISTIVVHKIITSEQIAQQEVKPRESIKIPVDYVASAKQFFSLPVEWKFAAGDTVSAQGIGARIDSIKDAFPNGKEIYVIFTGKAYFLNNEVTSEYDLSLRSKLSVYPDSGTLKIAGIVSDDLAVFDASQEEAARLREYETQIMHELTKKCSLEFMSIPQNATEIKGMSLNEITFYLD